jgi:hypothetical protein
MLRAAAVPCNAMQSWLGRRTARKPHTEGGKTLVMRFSSQNSQRKLLCGVVWCGVVVLLATAAKRQQPDRPQEKGKKKGLIVEVCSKRRGGKKNKPKNRSQAPTPLFLSSLSLSHFVDFLALFLDIGHRKSHTVGNTFRSAKTDHQADELFEEMSLLQVMLDPPSDSA